MLLTLAAAVIVTTPALLLLPLNAMLRDHRGALLFYAWSVADTAVIAVVARMDGGERSALWTLLFLTMAFMAVAYPPHGVVLMGRSGPGREGARGAARGGFRHVPRQGSRGRSRHPRCFAHPLRERAKALKTLLEATIQICIPTPPSRCGGTMRRR